MMNRGRYKPPYRTRRRSGNSHRRIVPHEANSDESMKDYRRNVIERHRIDKHSVVVVQSAQMVNVVGDRSPGPLDNT